MNKLQAKTTIQCNTCCNPMKRSKTIKVVAVEKNAAILEAQEKFQKWQQSLVGQNCKVCKTIIAAVAAN